MSTTDRPGSSGQVLLSGLRFVECPRWYEDRLYFCQWGTGELVAVDLEGASEVAAQVASFPFCIDPAADGGLLVLAGSQSRVYTLGADGELSPYADLSGLSTKPWNEIITTPGRVYANNIGFAYGVDEPARGHIAEVTPDGRSRIVAEDLAFPNGMAILADGATLVVAESNASRLTAFDITASGELEHRRVWADLGDGAPDGICADSEGAIWYADVPYSSCVRVREGGEVMQTIDVGLGAFSCTLGGVDGSTLFVTAAAWPDIMDPAAPPSGQVLVFPAPAPRLG